jgi:uncharacterized protein YdeI (YjbR/CyaY-like superfamily)
MKRYQDVDSYINGHPEWAEGLLILRAIMQSTELIETVKWGAPHYTINGKNVIGLAAFKNHFAVWFHQGTFLSDPDNLLYNAQEGKTKGLRQIRYTDAKQIKKRSLKKYVIEAIANQKAGLEIKPSKSKSFAIPSELQSSLEQDALLKSAFQNFTPGKQREFAEYISEAKRTLTKMKRLEKIIPMILSGIGLNDRYR